MKFSTLMIATLTPVAVSAFVMKPAFAVHAVPHGGAQNPTPTSTECSAVVPGPASSSDLHPYYQLKTPHRNTGLTHPSPGGPSPGALGLTPRGPSIPYAAKVDNLLARLAEPHLTDLDKYNLLHTVQDSDEKLYYKAIMENTHLLMPFVYTPTVGTACLKW